MTPNDIIKGMQEKNRQLQYKETELVNMAEVMALAGRSYRVARAESILRLKADGHAATLIQDLAKGDKGVAKLKMEYVIAEAVYKACRDSMYNLRAALDSYRSILSQKKLEYETEHKKSEHTT